jgi:signal transduction histidine kinase
VGEHHGYVRLTVEDDGNGIPAGERSRVFQRFTRLDESRVRDDGGTGLGLAIVQAIVDDHGGSIHIDDSELGGARFTVELPASNTASNKPPAHDHASG